MTSRKPMARTFAQVSERAECAGGTAAYEGQGDDGLEARHACGGQGHRKASRAGAQGTKQREEAKTGAPRTRPSSRPSSGRRRLSVRMCDGRVSEATALESRHELHKVHRQLCAAAQVELLCQSVLATQRPLCRLASFVASCQSAVQQKPRRPFRGPFFAMFRNNYDNDAVTLYVTSTLHQPLTLPALPKAASSRSSTPRRPSSRAPSWSALSATRTSCSPPSRCAARLPTGSSDCCSATPRSSRPTRRRSSQ